MGSAMDGGLRSVTIQIDLFIGVGVRVGSGDGEIVGYFSGTGSPLEMGLFSDLNPTVNFRYPMPGWTAMQWLSERLVVANESTALAEYCIPQLVRAARRGLCSGCIS
jgi:hypothetical protein